MIQINPRSPKLLKVLKYLLVALASALLTLMLFSCGARKVNKQNSKEEIKTESVDNSVIEKKSETNVKETTTVKTDDKNETITEETTYEPKDPLKESFIIEKDGTKVILNNVKKTVKKTIQKNNTATISNSEKFQSKNNVSKEQKAVKQEITSKKENNSKEVEKKQFNPFELLYLIIPILIIYIAYRIYKKLPLVPKF